MTSRHPAWKRTRLLASSTAIAALTGTLLLTTVPVAQADETIASAQSDTSETEGFSSTESTSNSTGTLPADAGATIAYNQFEATSDALGRGYEQRVALSKTSDGFVRVNIFEPQSLGGAFISGFNTDVKSEWPQGFDAMNFQGIGLIDKAGLPVNHVAVIGGSVYISEVKTKLNTSGMYSHWDADGSRVHVYNAANGSKQTGWGITVGNEKSVVTAMDAISYGGKDYLAVGLNYRGLRIVDLSTWSEIGSVYEDWAGNADTISAIKFGIDDQGKLLVATSKFTTRDWALWVAEVTINNGKATGTTVTKSNYRPWNAKWQWASALAFGTLGTSGKTQLAVGWPTPDRTEVLPAVVDRSGTNPTLDEKSSAIKTLTGTDNELVRSLRFLQTAEGYNRLAVVSAKADNLTRRGRLVSSENGTLTTVRDTNVEDLAGTNVPGYKAMTVNLRNDSRDNTKVKFYSSANPLEGCWLSGELAGGTPFRETALTSKGQPGSVFTSFGVARSIAPTSVDPSGVCSDEPGVFEVGVSLPDGSGEQTAKVIVDNNSDIPRLDGQDGNGRFVIDLEKSGEAKKAGLLGSWTITVADRYESARPLSAPDITASRLTPAPDAGWVDKGGVDDPSRPVYRFAVENATWNVPGASESLTETTLPAPQAQASTDGVTWNTLGALNPVTAPTREGNTVKLGAASFDWQISPGTPPYAYFRVVNGDEAHPSAVIAVADVPAPSPAEVQTITFDAGTRTRTLIPNGLDQLRSGFSLKNTQGTVLDPSDPENEKLYDRVYFRDSVTKALLTGLSNPNAPGRSTVVSTLKGAYPGDGSSSVMNVESRSIYISTTNTTDSGRPTAIFRRAGNLANLNPLPPEPLKFSFAPSDLGAVGAGGSGLSVEQCTEGQCTIENPTETNPAVFAAGEGRIGLQFRTRGILDSLPLGGGQKFAGDSHILGSALDIVGSKAILPNGHEYASHGTFRTVLVAHGQRVSAAGIPARG